MWHVFPPVCTSSTASFRRSASRSLWPSPTRTVCQLTWFVRVTGLRALLRGMAISFCYLLPQYHVARAQASKSLRMHRRENPACTAEAPLLQSFIGSTEPLVRKVLSARLTTFEKKQWFHFDPCCRFVGSP